MTAISSTLCNVRDYEAAARERLPPAVYDFYAGGAADEITVRDNEAAWGRVRLRPRVLVDVSDREATEKGEGPEVVSSG